MSTRKASVQSFLRLALCVALVCVGAYAFPKHATGKREILQGSYYPRKLSQAEIDHMASESSREVKFVADTHELNVSSVLVLDA
jgi:hypothetical protein